MEFARKNGLPRNMEGRASLLTQERISDHCDRNYYSEPTEHDTFLGRMNVLFNDTDLSEYLSNFLEGET